MKLSEMSTEALVKKASRIGRILRKRRGFGPVLAWAEGREPEERGWVFDNGAKVAASQLHEARTRGELRALGVPDDVVRAARKAGSQDLAVFLETTA
jgi:hypothetical protein